MISEVMYIVCVEFYSTCTDTNILFPIWDLTRSHKTSFNKSLHTKVGITLINNVVYSGNSQIHKHWTKIALFKPHIRKYIFLFVSDLSPFDCE